jgi:hypothetical protein
VVATQDPAKVSPGWRGAASGDPMPERRLMTLSLYRLGDAWVQPNGRHAMLGEPFGNRDNLVHSVSYSLRAGDADHDRVASQVDDCVVRELDQFRAGWVEAGIGADGGQDGVKRVAVEWSRCAGVDGHVLHAVARRVVI